MVTNGLAREARPGILVMPEPVVCQSVWKLRWHMVCDVHLSLAVWICHLQLSGHHFIFRGIDFLSNKLHLHAMVPDPAACTHRVDGAAKWFHFLDDTWAGKNKPFLPQCTMESASIAARNYLPAMVAADRLEHADIYTCGY